MGRVVVINNVTLDGAGTAASPRLVDGSPRAGGS